MDVFEFDGDSGAIDRCLHNINFHVSLCLQNPSSLYQRSKEHGVFFKCRGIKNHIYSCKFYEMISNYYSETFREFKL